MRISSVSYGFTKNVGNFQSQRVDVRIDLAEGDSPDEALECCVAFVNEALGEALEPREEHLLTQLRRSIQVLEEGRKG